MCVYNYSAFKNIQINLNQEGIIDATNTRASKKR